MPILMDAFIQAKTTDFQLIDSETVKVIMMEGMGGAGERYLSSNAVVDSHQQLDNAGTLNNSILGHDASRVSGMTPDSGDGFDGIINRFSTFKGPNNISGAPKAFQLTDSLKVELLKVGTLMIEYLGKQLVEHRKDLIKFAWNHLKADDLNVKNWAYVNVCRFIAVYETPTKIIIQVSHIS
jgi:hypothetical protein